MENFEVSVGLGCRFKLVVTRRGTFLLPTPVMRRGVCVIPTSVVRRGSVSFRPLCRDEVHTSLQPLGTRRGSVSFQPLCRDVVSVSFRSLCRDEVVCPSDPRDETRQCDLQTLVVRRGRCVLPTPVMRRGVCVLTTPGHKTW